MNILEIALPLLNIWRKIWLTLRYGLVFIPPNYAFFEFFNPEDYAIDVGCSNNPDLALYLIKHYRMHVVVVDPPRKHKETLQNLEHENSMLSFIPYAL